METTTTTTPSIRERDGVGKIREEVNGILYVFGKTESVSERDEGLVRSLREALECWEKGEEFGVRSRVDDDEDEEGEWRVEWGWTQRGEVEARWINQNVNEGEEGIQLPSLSNLETLEPTAVPTRDQLIRVSPGIVVSWLKEIGRKELSAGLFLRWLDELRVLQQAQVSSNEEEQVGLAKK